MRNVLVLPLCAGLGLASAHDVCFKGYVMDSYCIKRGHLLDHPGVRTLERPGIHSVHCLVDPQ